MSLFLVQIVLIISLGAIIVIASRALPRLPEENREPRRNGSWTLVIEKKLPLERIDAAMHSILEKALRKAKLFIMKADNSVNIQLGRLKKTTPAKNGSDSSGDRLEVLSDSKLDNDDSLERR